MALPSELTILPAPVPPPYLSTKEYITVHHGYLRVPLLTLPCFPATPGGHDYAIPEQLVLDAMSIIASNAPGRLVPLQKMPTFTGRARRFFKVYATSDELPAASGSGVGPGDRTAKTETTGASLPLLAPGKYLYLLLDEAAPSEYPVCGDFRSWAMKGFPPLAWMRKWQERDEAQNAEGVRTSQVGEDEHGVFRRGLVKHVDKRCCITADCSRLSTSHFVPVGEAHWFAYHDIAAELEITDIHDLSNMCTMRADIGMSLDFAHFCIYPYNMATGTWQLRFSRTYR
ncbi:hypothetical protein B0H17DRAFT_297189 [Mycena rosella]|uniref:HNH nuclease domain-containing protein n=1 Tax=Mycena rosella TaxID=1033263 RepID=A0AAD7DTV4_MYCRO|nr:hypothetical protein B0H17DRAFT_297189 [Mycena rosella]